MPREFWEGPKGEVSIVRMATLTCEGIRALPSREAHLSFSVQSFIGISLHSHE